MTCAKAKSMKVRVSSGNSVNLGEDRWMRLRRW